MEVTRGCLPDAAPSTPRFPALARVALACVLALAALAALATPAAAQTDGICGRTAQVQTAILGQISGITDCAAVTPAHLAGITGTLDLSEQNITAIAAGDFAGLTALTELNLNLNALSTLPADVFDGLTALTRLDLQYTGLTTLPAGVFENLTALTELDLAGNPGAPFAPTAAALPALAGGLGPEPAPRCAPPSRGSPARSGRPRAPASRAAASAGRWSLAPAWRNQD